MKKQKHNFKNGFTLIELLIVIAIIGILAGIVTVSSRSSIDKAKRSSALTTAASVLPELVTCADDSGIATNATPTTTKYICCDSGDTTCATRLIGHDQKWPDINTSTGWSYGTVGGSLSGGDYNFTVTGPAGSTSIKCKLDANGCCDVGSANC